MLTASQKSDSATDQQPPWLQEQLTGLLCQLDYRFKNASASQTSWQSALLVILFVSASHSPLLRLSSGLNLHRTCGNRIAGYGSFFVLLCICLVVFVDRVAMLTSN